MASDNSINELSPSSPEKTQIKTAKDFYQRRILQSEKFPKTPNDLPSSVIIPKNAVGDFEKAVLQTVRSGKETSQSIFWNAQKEFRRTRLFEGTELDIGNSATNSRNKIAYFGEKPLVAYHTHPRSWSFSAHDVAGSAAFPRDGYIGLVGSNQAIIGLFQTEPSTKLPFFAVDRAFRTKRYLNKEGFESIGQLSKLADIVKKLGFGLYYWLPPSGAFQEGDLKDGLPMMKA